MSIEDLRQSGIDNASANTEFSEVAEQHLNLAPEGEDGLEVAQAQIAPPAASDALPVEAAATAIPTLVKPDENNVVTLPATVDLDNLEFEVAGNDLVLVLADGTEITVQGGAANIPTFVIGEVELPQVVLFAALEDSNINVAAGPDGGFSAQAGSPSNGGDFNDDPYADGPGDLGLIDLLGDTSFGDEFRTAQIFGGNGAPSIDGELEGPFRFEEALIADGVTGNESFSGTLPFNPGPDSGRISAIGFGPAGNVDEEGNGSSTTLSLTSGGVPVQFETFPAPTGTALNFLALRGFIVVDGVKTPIFEITVDNRTTGDFTFKLIGKLDHPDAGADGSQTDDSDIIRLGFNYTVTDNDGDSVTGNFEVDILDDAPSFAETTPGSIDEEFLDGGNVDEDMPVESAAQLSDEIAGISIEGSLGVNWGADNGNARANAGLTGEVNDLGVAFTAATIAALEARDPALTSDGALLKFELSNNGTTLTAYKSFIVDGNIVIIDYKSGPVFAVNLSDGGAGSYIFTLYGNLDHVSVLPEEGGEEARTLLADGDEEDLSISFQFTVQDSDGDTATSTFVVNVNDDSPLIGKPEDSVLDEEDLPTAGNRGDSYEAGDLPDGEAGPRGFPIDGGRAVTGGLGVSWGADDNNQGGKEISLSFQGYEPATQTVRGENGALDTSVTVYQQAVANSDVPLTSGGEPVYYFVTVVDGKPALVGFTGSEPTSEKSWVFKVTLDDNVENGEYQFTLLKPLDHPEKGLEDDLRLEFDFRATDSDGDFADGAFSITIDDDAPVIGAPAAKTVEDEKTANGNDETESPIDLTGQATGSLSINWGSDNGNNGSGGLGDRSVAFTTKDVTVSGGLDGKFTSIGLPVNTVVLEDGTLIAYTGDIKPTVATGEGAENVVFYVTLSDTGSDNKGAYTFTLVKPLDHANDGTNSENSLDLTFNFKATDSDGDTVTSSFKVTVVDDKPELAKVCPIEETANEDDISTMGSAHQGESLGTSPNDGNRDGTYTGNPPSDSTGPAFLSGSLTGLVKVGADNKVTFSFIESATVVSTLTTLGLSSKGQPLSYELKDGILYAFDNENNDGAYQSDADRLVFTLEIKADGSYAFSLHDQLDHDAPADDRGDRRTDADQNEDLQDKIDGDVTAIDFGSLIKATDNDGDSVVLKDAFSIKIRDDVPELSGKKETRTVDEDDIATGDSRGTSPNDGDQDDDSLTGNPPSADKGPAFISGSLERLVDGGADDTIRFSFIDGGDAAQIMDRLGLSSKGEELSYEVKNGVLYAYDNDRGGPGFGDGDRLVFKLTLDSDGSYEFELHDQLDHDKPYDDRGDGEGLADENTDLRDGSSHFDVTEIDFGKIIKVTDHDGDSITLGGAFKIEIRDDVPTAKAENTKETLIVDETDDRQNDDIKDALRIFAGLRDVGVDRDMDPQFAQQQNFVKAVINGGADDGVNVDWSLELTDPNSGLETTDGKAIKLYVEGDLIVGRYEGGHGNSQAQGQGGGSNKGAAAFAIHIADDGTLSMVQYVSIKHDDPSDRDEADDATDSSSSVLQTLAGKINAVLTVTDYDGDKAVSKVQIGDRIQFEDDGPSVKLTLNNKASIVIDETEGGRASNLETDLAGGDLGSVKISAKSLFTESVSYGADGAATQAAKVYSLSIKGSNKESGLLDAVTNEKVMLVDNNGVIEGQISGGRVVFTIAVDAATGEVTVTQLRAVEHSDKNSYDELSSAITSGKLELTVTVKDGDNDTDRDSIDLGSIIRFRDDGPKVGGNETVVLEDDDQTNGIDGGDWDNEAPKNSTGTLSHDFGADGGSIALTGVDLPQDLGFKVASNTGSELVVMQTQGDKDIPVLKIVIDPQNGDYTVTQLAAIRHPSLNGRDGDNKENNVDFTIKYRVTDGDNDTANGTLKVTIDDDMPDPKVTVPTGTLVVHDETAGLQENDVNSSFPSVPHAGGSPVGVAQSAAPIVTVDPRYGADGQGSVRYEIDVPGDKVSSGLLTTSGKPITLFEVSPTLVVGRYDGADGGSSVEDTDPAAFAIQIDPTTGVVTIAQYVALQHPNGGDSHNELLALGKDKLRVTVAVEDADGDKVEQRVEIGDKIGFKDDGPKVTLTIKQGAEIVIDETDGVAATGEVDGPNGNLGTATVAASAVFDQVFNYGADEAAAQGAKVYGLSVSTGGVETGLVDPASNMAIRLYNNNGVIEGRVGATSPVIFTVSVNATTGEVTVTQLSGVKHTDTTSHDELSSQITANALRLSVTIKDGDGDIHSQSADLGSIIKFKDDGPSVKSESISLSVDEDGLPDAAKDAQPTALAGEVQGSNSATTSVTVADLKALFNFGADGAHASEAISLKAPASGAPELTSQGKPIQITVSSDGKTLTGTADGREVFTLKLSNDGSTYSFELKDQIDHPSLDGQTGDNTENSLPLDLSAYIVGKDGDGDTVSLTPGKFVINVQDDIPSVDSGKVGIDVQPPQISQPVSTKVANFVLVLDTSGSTNLENIEDQVQDFLRSASASGAKDVRVHIVEFSDSAEPVGTFDLIVNGVPQSTVLQQAITAVENLRGGGETNYEDGLQQAQQWIERTIEVTDELRAFDADSGTDGSNTDETAYVIGNGTTQIALVSGWNVPGTSGSQLNDVRGDVGGGWGVEDSDVDRGEFLRFDFGAFNDFDNTGAYQNYAGFSGIPVTSATFSLNDDWTGGTTTFGYTVYFVDGTSQAERLPVNNNDTALTVTGIDSNAGKQIAYIEFTIPADASGWGEVDLRSVASPSLPGPLDNAHVNEVIFISDGKPNRTNSDSDADVDDVLEEIQNEIRAIETDGDGTVGREQAFRINAFGVGADTAGIGVLAAVEGTNGSSSNLTPGSSLSQQMKGVLDSLAATPGASTPSVGGFNIGTLVKVGADEAIKFTLKDTPSSVNALRAEGLKYGGVALDYEIEGNTVTAKVGSTVVFTLVLQANGQGTFTLNKPVDGPGDKVIDFSTLIQAEDRDGDAVSLAPGKFTVTLDGVPAGAPQTLATSEDNSVSGQIIATVGEEGGQFTISNGAAHGSISLDVNTGAFTYTPDKNWHGTDSFTVKVTDDDGQMSQPIVVTVNVSPVNDKPVITSGSEASINENAPASTVVYTATATDVDGPSITYSLRGTDADKFNIDQNGRITFKTSPNFERPTDTGGDNVYDIKVVASDGNLEDVKDVAITVKDVLEAPTVQSINIADTALKAGETTAVTIVFSDKVQNFDNSDVVAENGTLSALTSSDGKTWTGTFTPNVDVEDTSNVIRVGTFYTDLDGNAGVAGTSANYTIDTLRPTATIGFADSTLTAGETTLVTITFNEPVSGLTNADLTVTNGTLTPVSSSDGGKTWTATFTPAAGTEFVGSPITLANPGVVDAAGNTGLGTTNSVSVTIDTLRPSATISFADSTLTAGESTQVTFAFNEPVTGFSNADLTIANGSLTEVTSVDGKIWTATFTPSANVQDTSNVITLDNTGVRDLLGNAGVNTSTSGNYVIDTIRPTATITFADSTLTAGESTQVTFAFNEPVTGFSNADLTIANGVLTEVSSNDGGKTWTATFTPDAGKEDLTNVITLDNTGVRDLLGNAGTGTTNSGNYVVDTVRPTAGIVIDDTNLTAGETTTVTITFSEQVTGLEIGDFNVQNGSLSNLQPIDGGKTWTATLTPAAGINNDTSNLITLNNTQYTDLIGNTGQGTTDSVNYTVNTVVNRAPTANNDTLFAASGPAAPTGEGWTLNQLNGHYYKIVSGNFSWSAASAAASAEGGYLATITSATEQTFVQNLPNPNFAQYVWIGASDRTTEGTWQWVTGPEAGTTFWTTTGGTSAGQYSNWGSGEPNDSLMNEDYAEMALVFGGRWNDQSGASAISVSDYNGYVVEWSATGGVSEDKVTTFSAALLTANDTDPDSDTLSVVSVSATSTKGASIVLNADGTVSYDPRSSTTLQNLNAGGRTIDTFTYTVSDGKGGTSTATVTITVNGANEIVPLSVNEATSAENRYVFSAQSGASLNFNTSTLFTGGILPLTYSFSKVSGPTDESWLSRGASVAGNPSTGQAGLYIYKVTATDLGGASVDTYAAFTALASDSTSRTIQSASQFTSANRTVGDLLTISNNAAQNQTLNAGDGRDVVIGNANVNTINGDGGSDAIYGMGGNDVIDGGAEIDFIDGGADNDTLRGGAGNDVILGGSGDDTLFGGTGNDILVGGSGGDTFVWDQSYTGTSANSDVITDYQRGQNDVVELRSDSALDINLVTVTASGGDLQVRYNSNVLYTLQGAATTGVDKVLIRINGTTYKYGEDGSRTFAADPIILDLDKNGFALSSIGDGVSFDIDADGNKDQIAWTSDDGILAYDANGNGTIDDGSEIFTPDFNGGKFASGVAALASLDSNGDGKIDAGDAAFKDLKIWVDADNDGISDDGELSSLSDNDVASISLTTDQTGGEEDGQTVFAEGEFTFEDGSTGDFLEVGFDTIFGSDTDGLTVLGTDGDDLLHGGMGQVTLTGGAGADTFVFDAEALSELDVADVITDYSLSEGDALDVSALLDTLLGAEADASRMAEHVKVATDGTDTTLSVDMGESGWKDIVVLQNHTEAVKILFDDKHSTTFNPDLNG